MKCIKMYMLQPLFLVLEKHSPKRNKLKIQILKLDQNNWLQSDSVRVDLGQVVNAGFSKKWGGNKPEHNTLAIKVRITAVIMYNLVRFIYSFDFLLWSQGQFLTRTYLITLHTTLVIVVMSKKQSVMWQKNSTLLYTYCKQIN